MKVFWGHLQLISPAHRFFSWRKKEKSRSTRTNKEGTLKLNYLFNMVIFICWVKFWWFVWGTFHEVLFFSSADAVTFLEDRYLPSLTLGWADWSKNFDTLPNGTASISVFYHVLIYLCFIQRAVVTEHRRSIVWSYFAAVNENIAKCDVYRKSGHYCGNTTNRFKRGKKHEKKYRAAAAKKGARGVKCLISTQTPQHWDGVHWQRGIQVYTVQ